MFRMDGIQFQYADKLSESVVCLSGNRFDFI